MSLEIVESDDFEMAWRIIEPVLRAGDTYGLPQDMSKEAARAWWMEPRRRRFVARDDGAVLGIYTITPNQAGPGAHVANGGYMVAEAARGRGVAKALCRHSVETARAQGYRAMQFNFVASTNETAIRAWKACGFEIVGTLPGAFKHPRAGYVDAYVMYQTL